MRKVSDCVAGVVAGLGIRHVFGVSGGGAMHLVDSFGNREGLTYIPNHHEQASAMAAEAYARMNGIGCALVTTGPGGTNAITGVACAWVDSIPVLFLSGQVTSDTMINGHGLRQFGVQESDIVSMVRSVTKYAVTVTNEFNVRYELEKAVHIARSGRPGPVWVDIPLDIQGKKVPWEMMRSYRPEPEDLDSDSLEVATDLAADMLEHAKRPVLILGHGVRLAGAQKEAYMLVHHLGIPVVSSWSAADIVETENPYYIGRFGMFGDRASNFAVQNADFLLVLGSRLSIPQVGHNFATFARAAQVAMVDIDHKEMAKPSLHVDLRINADVKDFLRAFKGQPHAHHAEYLAKCRAWRAQYPVVSSENRDGPGINSFKFIDALSDALPNDAVVVTDMGTAFTCTFQAARMRLGQRWITASGHAPMGYGLPGAIGAHYATGRRVVCIVGDGALQFNVQELQTIAHHKLPITIFVLNNGGYLTIKHMQANHFGRAVGSDAASGVSCPPTMALAEAFGISCWSFGNVIGNGFLKDVLQRDGPTMCEIKMAPDQPLIPRTASEKRADGSIFAKPLEDMLPFLPREEFRAQMIVEPVE